MSKWAVLDSNESTIQIDDTAIIKELDRMRDAIIWKSFFGAKSPVSVESNSKNVFVDTLDDMDPNEPIYLIDSGNGKYELTFCISTKERRAFTLENTDSNATRNQLLKTVLPATGLFATVVGLGYFSAKRFYKKTSYV